MARVTPHGIGKLRQILPPAGGLSIYWGRAHGGDGAPPLSSRQRPRPSPGTLPESDSRPAGSRGNGRTRGRGC